MTYEEIKNNEEINSYIRQADASLVALGFRGLLFSFLHRARRFFSFSIKRTKRMGAQKSGRPMVAPTFIDGSAMEIVETGGQSRPPLHSKTMVRWQDYKSGPLRR